MPRLPARRSASLQPHGRDVVLRALLVRRAAQRVEHLRRSSRRSSRAALRGTACVLEAEAVVVRARRVPGDVFVADALDDRVVVDAVVRRRLRSRRAGKPVRDALRGVRLLRRLHRVDHEHVDRVRPPAREVLRLHELDRLDSHAESSLVLRCLALIRGERRLDARLDVLPHAPDEPAGLAELRLLLRDDRARTLPSPTRRPCRRSATEAAPRRRADPRDSRSPRQLRLKNAAEMPERDAVQLFRRVRGLPVREPRRVERADAHDLDLVELCHVAEHPHRIRRRVPVREAEIARPEVVADLCRQLRGESLELAVRALAESLSALSRYVPSATRSSSISALALFRNSVDLPVREYGPSRCTPKIPSTDSCRNAASGPLEHGLQLRHELVQAVLERVQQLAVAPAS